MVKQDPKSAPQSASTPPAEAVEEVQDEFIEITEEEILNAATTKSVGDVTIRSNKLPKGTFTKIVNDMTRQYRVIHPVTVARGLFLLFLRGAGNYGTPLTLSVEVKGEDGELYTISKRDLMFYYHMITKNEHLRRLAEPIADEISKFAETNGLSGDLAKQIDRRLRATVDENGKSPGPLTPKERAWCSSFNQDNATLNTDPGLARLGRLLAQDLEVKFGGKTQGKQGKGKPVPKKAKAEPEAVKAAPKRKGQKAKEQAPSKKRR